MTNITKNGHAKGAIDAAKLSEKHQDQLDVIQEDNAEQKESFINNNNNSDPQKPQVP